MLKYVFLLKRVLYVQIENTLLLRVLFIYFLFLCLASINSILSKFGGALRYICWLFNNSIPFVFNKMLRSDDDDDGDGEIVCHVGAEGNDNF